MPVDFGEFKQKLVYQDEISSSQLTASLNQIREFDRSAESTRSAINWTIAISLLTAIASGIIAAISQLVFLLPVACIAGIVFIASMIFGQLHQKYDLANRRYELVDELARVLSRDMPKDSQFKLTLDLAPTNQSRKKTTQGKVGTWNVTYFEDPWLQLAGRFADGTAFEITMLERFQERKKQSRSRSGKTKSKSKSKTATIAAVTLNPKLKKYPNLERVTHRLTDSVRLPTWMQVKKLVAEHDTLMITATTSVDWSVKRFNPKTGFDGSEGIIMMLLSLYQVLQISKSVPSV